MSRLRSLGEIDCWRVARILNQGVRQLIATGAFQRDFALLDQINRAAGSTMDNFAEGFDGDSNAEFARFLSYTQRSCSELRRQLYRALDRKHFTESRFQELPRLSDGNP